MKNVIYILCLSSILFVWTIPFSDAQSREGSSVNLDSGIGIVSPDSSLSFNFRFFMQNLIEYETPVNSGGESDFSARIQRLRLQMEGFLMDPKLIYKFQLELASKSTSSAIGGRLPQAIYEAMIYYRFSERFRLGFGQTVVPGTRQMMNSGAALQLVDRSLLNSVFGLDLEFGLFAEYKIDPSAARPVVLHAAVTSGAGGHWAKTGDGGLSYIGRVDWYPLGLLMGNGGYQEGDLEWHETSRVMIGGAYNFNHKAKRSGGQKGFLLSESRDIMTMTADFMFKYRGWSLLGDFVWGEGKIRMNGEAANRGLMSNGRGWRCFRIVGWRDSKNSMDGEAAEPGFIFNGKGLNFQAGRYVLSGWEFVGKYSKTLPDIEIQDVAPEQDQWTLGLNKYIRGRK